MSKVYSWRKLNEKELTRVYLDEMRRDFPPTELKPLSMILNSEADGTAHTWGVFDGETLAAYLLMVRPAGSRVSQLDYFAVLPEYRSAGLGAQLLGFVVLVILVAAQEGAITSKTIYSIENDALCGQTGLQAGDEIVAVNGRRCFVANDILYELVRTEAYRARFTVKRDGQKVELPDVQFDTWQDEDGQTHMTLGFTVYGIKKTPLNVLKEAWNSTLYYGRIAFISLADLVRGRESINNLSGPVGIVTAIGQAASYGWQDLLELLALITINLGVFNLLPFPALDGGKVVFLIIEGVTGHAVPEKLQGTLTIAAFALLFGLMLFATYNDIIRLVTGAM